MRNADRLTRTHPVDMIEVVPMPLVLLLEIRTERAATSCQSDDCECVLSGVEYVPSNSCVCVCGGGYLPPAFSSFVRSRNTAESRRMTRRGTAPGNTLNLLSGIRSLSAAPIVCLIASSVSISCSISWQRAWSAGVPVPSMIFC